MANLKLESVAIFIGICKVNLAGIGKASQNDLFILAKGENQLISIMVEGKVDEPLGQTVKKWKSNTDNKEKRLNFLLEKIKLNKSKVDSLKYQLIHRTASVLITAESFCTKNAVVIIQSFSKKDTGFIDYCKFLDEYKIKAQKNKIHGPIKINDIDLY